MKKVKDVTIAFAGNQTVLNELWERIEYADEIAKEHDIRPALASITSIFKPETGMPQYRMSLEDKGELGDRYNCEIFGVLKNHDWRYYIIVEGNPDEISDMCQRACDLLGITCCVSTRIDKDASALKTLTAATKTKPQPVNAVLYDVP